MKQKKITVFEYTLLDLNNYIIIITFEVIVTLVNKRDKKVTSKTTL